MCASVCLKCLPLILPFTNTCLSVQSHLALGRLRAPIEAEVAVLSTLARGIVPDTHRSLQKQVEHAVLKCREMEKTSRAEAPLCTHLSFKHIQHVFTGSPLCAGLREESLKV